MKQLLILFALVAVGSSSIWKGGFRIKFDVGSAVDIGRSFFFEIPRTVSEAVSEGWVTQTQPDGLPVTSVTMYCYSDNVVCTFYDGNGDVAGVQVGDKFTPYFDNMETVGFTTWEVNGQSFWTLQQYFTTEEILASQRVRMRMSRENQNKITENGGVWVVGTHKEVVKISNSTDEITNEGVFTKQACIPWMGHHYYYKMSPSMNCTAEAIFPWFPIVESGELIAMGFVVPGVINLESSDRNWFEHPDRAAIKTIVPDGPECLYDVTDSPGLVTMHIYYIDQPWLVSCPSQ